MEKRVTGLESESGQDSLKAMQEDLSTVKEVQAQLLSTVTTMGSDVDMLLHADQSVSPEAADEKVADSVSSRAGARELPPLVEEDDMEDDDATRGLLSSEDNKTTTVKTLPTGIGGPAISGGQRSVSPPLMPFSGTLGKASTSGTFKLAGKGFLDDRPDSPQSGVSGRTMTGGLRVGQLKMDMPPVFSASRQQNARGWLQKMERYFKLMRYPADTWIEVVATRLTDAAEAWFNGESQ